ncbi:MAG TPA: histidine phosphatase family protein [Caulobacteraceae bacterium]|nr:histidine phosphatase family protein [Caulobacteraceae bacterium]
MDRLILMRHARAERRAPSGDDFDRGLTEEGKADAALIGQALARDGLAPGVAVVSAAVRAEQTWEAVSQSFPRARTQVRRELYNAAPMQILDALEGQTAATVMVIAHNPGIHELVIGLLAEGGAGSAVISKVASRFPTSTAVAFVIDENGRAFYDGLFYAAELGGSGGE